MVSVAGRVVDGALLARLCERYGVGRLLIFGSAARGTMGPESDVDVLYELLPGRRLGWEIEQFADELAEIIGRPVDLVSMSALHRRLQPAGLAEAQPLYAA
jgi:predicted nucleotidyltransferase